MTPDLPDIMAFITARRNEDEAAAKAAGDGSVAGYRWQEVDPVYHPGLIGTGTGDVVIFNRGTAAYAASPSPGQAAHIARHDPARALRTIRAKRPIIGEQTCDHAPIESMYGTVCRTCVDWQDAPWDDGGETEFGIAIPQTWPCRVARSEAAAWSDHPDYRPEWAL